MRARVRLGVVLGFVLATTWMVGVPAAGAATDCVFTTSGTTMTLQGDCMTDETLFIPAGSP